MAARYFTRTIAFGLVISMAMNVGLLGYYGYLRSDQRAALHAKLSSLTHQSGPTVLLGDSIVADLSVPTGRLINLAVPGASVAWIEANQLAMIARLRPSRILLAAGINDLRAGASAEATASAIVSLGLKLTALHPDAQTVLLSILPPAEASDISGHANSERVQEANKLMLEGAAKNGLAAVDYAAVLSSRGALRDFLTYDGLHLNAAGRSIVEEILFHGLAGRHNRSVQ
ncbi:MAG: SGNH/GDSL hydrolase family protein [Beijerinckiaceae bacterium]